MQLERVTPEKSQKVASVMQMKNLLYAFSHSWKNVAIMTLL